MTFRARDQVSFDYAQDKLLTLLTSKKKLFEIKKSLTDMIRLLERETRFLSTALKINFSPY